MTEHPTVPRPAPVTTTVCGVCRGDWPAHQRAARDRVTPWFDDTYPETDYDARERALAAAEVSLVDCVTVLRDERRGPPGPVGAVGMPGRPGRDATRLTF